MQQEVYYRVFISRKLGWIQFKISQGKILPRKKNSFKFYTYLSNV